MSRLLIRAAALLALLVVIGFGSFVLAGRIIEDAPESIAQQPPPPSREELQALVDELNAIQAADTAELYSGPLGDFIALSGDDVSPSNDLCPTVRIELPSKESELFFTLPNGDSPDSANVCEDGTATFMYGAGAGGGLTVQRAYFTGRRPGVFLDAPLERIDLTTVAGRPAIITRPLQEVEQLVPFFALRRMAVIERFPSGDTPGVLLRLSGTGSEENALAAAEYVLTEGGLRVE